MKNILKKGHGIIITGGPGTGKTSLAKVIAASVGIFAIADFKGITGPFNSVFLTHPDVIVIDEFNPTSENLSMAKAFVANDKITVGRKGYDPQTVDSPLFIFVTNGAQVIKLAEADRRFTVIRMEG